MRSPSREFDVARALGGGRQTNCAFQVKLIPLVNRKSTRKGARRLDVQSDVRDLFSFEKRPVAVHNSRSKRQDFDNHIVVPREAHMSDRQFVGATSAMFGVSSSNVLPQSNQSNRSPLAGDSSIRIIMSRLGLDARPVNTSFHRCIRTSADSRSGLGPESSGKRIVHASSAVVFSDESRCFFGNVLFPMRAFIWSITRSGNGLAITLLWSCSYNCALAYIPDLWQPTR
jgi:hypothetical protein